MFTLLAKRVARFGLLACLILVMMSCDRNPQVPNVITDANALLNASPNVTSGDELQARFNQLAVILAQRAPNVIEKIIGTSEGEMSFDALKLDADLPREFVMSGGRTLETTLERAQPCQVTPKSKTAPIFFAPDPDRFQGDDENHICKGWRVENGNITPAAFTLDEYVNNLSHVPLYLVGYRERPNVLLQSLAKSSKTATAGDWVACYKIHMKKDQDFWSNEECEVYTEPLAGTSSRYNYDTNFLFNDTYRTDAAGRQPFFPDVNSTNTIYYCYDLPFFFQLTAQSQGWVAIEDDDNAGRHHSNYYGPPPVPTLPGPYYYKDVGVDVHHANGAKTWGTVRSFQYWRYAQGINDDDIWTSGCYEDFNTSWSVPNNVEVWYALNGNEFWMKKIVY